MDRAGVIRLSGAKKISTTKSRDKREKLGTFEDVQGNDKGK